MTEEMRSLAVRDCAEALKDQALREFLARSTSVDNFVRNWLGEHYPNKFRTPRTEIEQAVRACLGDTGWSPYKRSERPAVRSLEFESPLK